MRKHIKYTAYILATALLIGCGSITDKLKKSEAERIRVQLPAKEKVSNKQEPLSQNHIQEINDTINNRKGFLVNSEIDTVNGERIKTVDLEGITVIAKSRNIPERAGKVSLDFIVTVPENLISDKWQLKLTPVLFKANSERIEFERLLLSGADFLKTQQAGYNKYQEFVNSIIPDSLFLQEMINQKGYKRALADLEDSIYHAWKKDKKAQKINTTINERIEFFNKKMEKNRNHLRGEGIASILPQYWLMRKSDSLKLQKRIAKIEKRTLTKADSSALMQRFYLHKKIETNNWKKNSIEQKFSEYVRFPFEKSRLDTIIKVGKSFKYYYTQDVQADENTNKMKLTIEGMVLAKDESQYSVPESDTLTYYVSSMIQFLDYEPRYVKEIIYRKAEANLTSFIAYKSGKTGIDESLGENAQELEKIKGTIKSLTDTGEFLIDSIQMVATSSPEGTEQMNNHLSMLRAKELKKHLADILEDRTGVDTLITAKWIGEDWNKLSMLISTSEITNKSQLLDIISSRTGKDNKEAIIRKQYPNEYKYIRDEFYPKLRAVNFTFSLHRRGMIKDTIHTHVVDTVYASAIKMLEKRMYRQALPILSDYEDYNTAVCLMSLGYDERAIGIMLKQPDTANRNYLLAILYSRLGKNGEAIEAFQKSCSQDESKEFRGALDPEINKLIQKYGLNKTQY